MRGLSDSVAARRRDLWFTQLHCFKISLNKLARRMPISTYVRQERVHLTGRPKPGRDGEDPGRLPVPLPYENRQPCQLHPSLVNLSGHRQRKAASCIDPHGENNSAGRCAPCKDGRVGEEKLSSVL